MAIITRAKVENDSLCIKGRRVIEQITHQNLSEWHMHVDLLDGKVHTFEWFVSCPDAPEIEGPEHGTTMLVGEAYAVLETCGYFPELEVEKYGHGYKLLGNMNPARGEVHVGPHFVVPALPELFVDISA